jgi:hypothetical protein
LQITLKLIFTCIEYTINTFIWSGDEKGEENKAEEEDEHQDGST